MEDTLRWVLALSLLIGPLFAETGYDAWLRYPPPGTSVAITFTGNSPVLESARQELVRGLRTSLGREVVLRTIPGLKPDGYSLKIIDGKIVITGSNDRGVLYGAFALLRKVALGESVEKLDEQSEPRVPVRWVNHWDNLDGSIERG
jgi:alpha-glucuronidase